MGLIVVVVMLVLLFVAFGSLVLPVKAVLMNVVSITASFGVVTWIFADGHLEGLLGFESQGFLDATQPILMLARSEEHTSELQSRQYLVCRLLLEKKKN